MNLSFWSDCDEFLSFFKEINKINLDEHWEKWLKIFMLPINAKDFDYENLKERLVDPLLWYVLSRKTIANHSWWEMSISKKARNKIRGYHSNTWELWEFLLYCFLETDLKAPKILSKIELKTSSSDYVKGSDWIHVYKLWNNYVLLFWESKTIKDIKNWIKKALSSVHDFKFGIRRDKHWKEIERDASKFWIWYEKALISEHLLKEFDKEDEEFLKSILHPKPNSSFRVDNGFAIFIWFEIDLIELQKLSNEEFWQKLEELLQEQINKNIALIKDLIQKKDLHWHNMYFYFLPFSNLNENRKDITKHIIT